MTPLYLGENINPKPRQSVVEARAALPLKGSKVPTAHVGGRRREPFRANDGVLGKTGR